MNAYVYFAILMAGLIAGRMILEFADDGGMFR